MTDSRLRALPKLVLAVAIAAAALLPAPLPAAPGASNLDAAMIAALETELARPLYLPREIQLDPELRTEAEAIALAHLVRFSKLLPVWLEEEKRVQAGFAESGPNQLYDAVFARLLNEFALWHLDTGDADYERATLAVLKEAPQVCRIAGDRAIYDYPHRIQRIQAMPAAQRKLALAAERELLARWGKPRAAPPPWPQPLPQDVAIPTVAGIHSGAARPLPLIPVLASNLLAKEGNYGTLSVEGRCALQQWWLRVSLAQGAAPAAALGAFRYGTLVTALDRIDTGGDKPDDERTAGDPAAPPPYPVLGRRFSVTGSTTVARRLDAAGKPVEAKVVGRDISVAGIRGARPLAFENVFDAVSVRYALQGGAASAGAPLPERFALNWSLEPPRPATARSTPGPAAKNSGGKRQ